MELLGSPRLSRDQKILVAIFGVYVGLWVVDKIGLTLARGRAGAASTVTSWFRVGTMVVYGIVLCWHIYTVSDPQRTTRAPPSVLVLALLLAMYALHYYSRLDSYQSEKANEYAKSEWSNYFVVGLYIAALVISQMHVYDKEQATSGIALLVTSVCALIAVMYAAYGSFSVKSSFTAERAKAMSNAVGLPVLFLLFVTLAFFAFVGGRDALAPADQGKLSAAIRVLPVIAIPVVLSYMVGSATKDTVHHLNDLLVKKLIAVSKTLDVNSVYYEIFQKKVDDLLDRLVSVKTGTAPTWGSIKADLTVSTIDEAAAFQLTDQLPIHLTDKVETFLKTKVAPNNPAFSFEKFMYWGNRNWDPLKSPVAIAPFNGGILAVVAGGVGILGFGVTAYLAMRGKKALLEPPSFWAGARALATCGLFAYVGYLMRALAYSVDNRNAVFCQQHSLEDKQCAEARDKFNSSAYSFADRIARIQNGSGDIIVNSFTWMHDVKENAGPYNTTPNMAALYKSMYAVVPDFDVFQKNLTYLQAVAAEVNLKSGSSDERILVQATDNPEDVGAGRTLDQVSLADIIRLVTDEDGFAASVWPQQSPHVPNSNITIVNPNKYFNIGGAPLRLQFDYDAQGLDFRRALVAAMKARSSILDRIVNGHNISTFRISTSTTPMHVLSLYNTDAISPVNPQARVYPLLASAMQSFVQQLVIKGATDFKAVWRLVNDQQNTWEILKGTQVPEGGGGYLLVKLLKDGVDIAPSDKIALIDFVMHALEPAAVRPEDPRAKYDAEVNDYLRKLFMVCRLRAVQDTSAVTNDVRYIERNLMLQIVCLTAGAFLLVALGVFFATRTKITKGDYFSDWFKSSIAGSKTGIQTNGTVLSILFLVLVYGIMTFLNIYRGEAGALSNVIFGDKSYWGGKVATVPVIIGVCSLLMLLPMYSGVLLQRRDAFLVTCMLVATMFTPLIYFVKKYEKSVQMDIIKKMSSASLLAMFVLAAVLVINKDSLLVDKVKLFIAFGPEVSTWSILAGAVLVLALVATSLPALFMDVYMPDEDADVFKQRLGTVNIGAAVSIGIAACLYAVYFIYMKRDKLFVNQIPSSALPSRLHSF